MFEDDPVEVEFRVVLQYQVSIPRDEYDKIKDDLEDGLAAYEDASDLYLCEREVIEVTMTESEEEDD